VAGAAFNAGREGRKHEATIGGRGRGAVAHMGTAQTPEELIKGASDQHNVLNYGMGNHVQRFSLIDQINKDNVKDLVPV
jgi:glucose dehydrogenase